MARGPQVCQDDYSLILQCLGDLFPNQKKSQNSKHLLIFSIEFTHQAVGTGTMVIPANPCTSAEGAVSAEIASSVE